MLARNDPRLRYVNDGAAIRNPFAVDRKIQLNFLTNLLCKFFSVYVTNKQDDHRTTESGKNHKITNRLNERIHLISSKDGVISLNHIANFLTPLTHGQIMLINVLRLFIGK